nr:MAG TPA: hypothetical protein [Caudoviricetes sp.]
MPVSAPARAVTRRINTILHHGLSSTISPCPVRDPASDPPTHAF